MSASLLVELFTEELPPKSLRRLAESFARAIATGLKTRRLIGDDAVVRTFATPRRIAVHLSAVHAKAVDQPVEMKLMPLSVARAQDGSSSVALRKKLEALGRAQLADNFPKSSEGPDALVTKLDGKAEAVYLRTLSSGQPLARALDETLQETIEGLPVAKLMNYQLADGTTTVQFVRPAHGLVALHGTEVVNVSVLGLTAGRVTHGHRFQGARDISLTAADDYERALAAEGQVIADFEQRRQETERQLLAKAAELDASLGPPEDVSALLDEVTALIEHPSVYAGEFESGYLAVPQECLILTMRQNQKYFPLFNAAGKLTNRFLIVSNMRLAEPRHVIEGNQRVIRPRLADAKFFYDQDRRTRLADLVPRLADVVYHNKLGSQLDRVRRVTLLAQTIARELQTFEHRVARAAELAKADLLTHMVGEFPDLQGIMGHYYALQDGEDPSVATAIEEHYRPRFAGDALPETSEGTCVALADKLEALVGFFGIGQPPTGEKDPFGLRRAALGVLRILAEKSLPLDLRQLLDDTRNLFAGRVEPDASAKVLDFALERLRGYLRERGYAADEIEAVVSQGPTRIDLVIPRLNAVQAFRVLPEAESLAAANKRIRNILKKAPVANGAAARGGQSENSEEAALFAMLTQLSPVIRGHFDRQAYQEALLELVKFRGPVDDFFDKVMVMADDPVLRSRRLALLRTLDGLMNQVADISKLAA